MEVGLDDALVVLMEVGLDDALPVVVARVLLTVGTSFPFDEFVV